MEPTHHSHLDPKAMSVADLRKELRARGVNSKGLKSQLVAKLTKALKIEAEKTPDDDVTMSVGIIGEIDIDGDSGEERKAEVIRQTLCMHSWLYEKIKFSLFA